MNLKKFQARKLKYPSSKNESNMTAISLEDLGNSVGGRASSV